MKRILLSLAMALGAMAGSASAATIINGSFEAPTANVGSFNTYGAGSTALTGWTISNASIDHIGSGFWQASDGVQSVDLNGNQGASTISQVISGLVSGTMYQVLFDMAGNPQGAPDIKTMNVSVGMAGVSSYSFDTSATSTAAMGWVTNAYTFTAGATSGLLSFASTTSGCCFGPALDNVRIQAVVSPIPVPASGLLLLAGLGAVAGLRRRKRAS